MILNIILTLLIISSLRYLITGSRSNILYCGIWGFSGATTNEWNPLSKFKFQLLGSENDARGGDGVGIAWDNFISKSIDPKKFDDLWRIDGTIPDELKYPAIIGHDRKASIGSLTIDNTQPIFFNFEDKDKLVSGILAHNGTIYNYKDLYEKHKIEMHYEDTDISSMSDSQVLCLLIEKLGWSILSEYIGSAAFLYMDVNSPGVIYAYHGKSPMRKNAVETEERPLHYVIDGEQIWFSSTKAALEKITANKSRVTELPFNKVFRVEGSQITSVFNVNRSNVYQFEDVKSFPASNYHVGNHHDADYYGYSNDYGYYDADGVWRNYDDDEKKKNNKKKNRNITFELQSDICSSELVNYIYWEKGLGKLRISDDPPKDSDPILNGQIIVTKWGRIIKKDPSEPFDKAHLVLYFWKGNLCVNREKYINCINNEITYDKILSRSEIYKTNGGNFVYPFIIPKSIGGDPNIVFSNNIRNNWQINKTEITLFDTRFNGVISCPMGRNKEFRFTSGKLESAQYNIGIDRGEMYSRYSDEFPEEFATELIEIGIRMNELSSSFDDNSTLPAVIEKEEDPVCPTCRGTKMFDGETCSECLGNGYITEETILNEYKLINEDAEYLSAKTEEMKIEAILMEVIDEGISVLEEADIQIMTRVTYEKLLKAKELLTEE